MIEQLTQEAVYVFLEYVCLVIGFGISSIIVKYYKWKFKQLKEEGVPEEFLDLIQTLLKVFRPGFLGVFLMALFFKSTGHMWGNLLFMFAVGLVLGNEALQGTLIYEIAKHIKEILESELEYYEKKVTK